MNLLIILIPDTAVVLSSVLGALALILGGALAFVIMYRKKQKATEPEEEIEETAYTVLDEVPTEAPEGKLEKTYAPLFEHEFRANYDADYYVTKVKPKDIDTSSDVYKVDEEKVAAELDRAAGRKHKKPTPQIQTVGVVNKFVLSGAIEQAANVKPAASTSNAASSGTAASGKATGTQTLMDTTASGAASNGAASGTASTQGTQVDRSRDRVISSNTDGAVVIRGNSLFHIQYLKSYSAKLIQSEPEQKKYYSDIKNELLAYGLKPRTSWKAESFRKGRKKFAVLVMRGKTMCLLLALDPKKFDGTKYKVEDMSKTEWLREVPCLYRLKNPRRAKYAMELIAEAMEGVSRQEAIYTDYANMPELSTEELISRKLVKIVEHIQPDSPAEQTQPIEKTQPAERSQSTESSKSYQLVTPTQANVAMTDEVAKALIEEGDISDRRKIEIINIDALSENFKVGEKVTLDEVKKRIKNFNKKATALKVLARGTLDKSLTVEADDFSIEAVKMIALTGGKVIKKRRNG